MCWSGFCSGKCLMIHTNPSLAARLGFLPEADPSEVLPEGQAGPSEPGEPQEAACPVQADPYPFLGQEPVSQEPQE